jgi:hypothetical protein
MLKPSAEKKAKPIFESKSGAGRPKQSESGEARDKKINITFTASELEEIEKAMEKVGAELKTTFLRKIILESIR